MKNTILDKTKLVNSVFSKVHKKYDLMNDIMSFGVHRLWKKRFIDWMNPSSDSLLIDVASGTGDIAKLFSKKINDKFLGITCVEPNIGMFEEGRKNLKKFKNIKWIKASAEKLPLKSDIFDFYTISFGLRNVSDINKALSEAFRVLKPGGRFMCLEFSKIDNEILDFVYKQYSKALPVIGKYVVGTAQPYEYLINSIDKFYNQDQLIQLMKSNGFSNTEYRNLSNGVSAIHSGWKI
jgi:demethylmenaquinone methyltransferase / 2-methoxy-6-polyprenyl-1,4-benzoquinol methylase